MSIDSKFVDVRGLLGGVDIRDYLCVPDGCKIKSYSQKSPTVCNSVYRYWGVKEGHKELYVVCMGKARVLWR